ncbi:NAD(P)H-dependent oxidoreductase [Stenoxybacter acetivorans]|uniref:NAD(P)H-dependent oxidoreductase n=1 Tax=Stenoxybacter acetivorans TaxID=422441 RepID=UPI000B11502E|nr:NAD(P)H-dependent oxidoreductase [Stenoxybacter acetivorans]
MNILLLNSAKDFGHSHGKLNDSLHEVAKDFLLKNGVKVSECHIDDGYDAAAEAEKFAAADVVIHQIPIWWMSAPWITKKYMDEVFTVGYGKLYESDGRTRSDSSKKYGSGGLLHGKKYLFSVTWNAPLEAFTDPKQLFEGKGIDAVLFPLHKAHQFLGMEALPTFMCNDVIKDPHFDQYKADYEQHLAKVLQSLS